MNEYDYPKPEEQGTPGHRYDHLMPSRKKRGAGRIVARLILVVLLLAAVGGGVYYFASKGRGTKETAKTGASEQQQGPLTPAEAAKTVTFKSNKLNIELAHRKDWTLKESRGTGEITLTSPSGSYTSGSGSKKGVFTLKFATGVDDTTKQTVQSGKAVLPSEVIGYDNPTKDQRYFTSVTYVGTNNNVAYLIVTGADQYKPDDSLGAMFIGEDTLLVLGGFGGTDPSNFASFDPAPKTNFVNSRPYTQALEIIKSLKIY
jgi:hypothetical protein